MNAWPSRIRLKCSFFLSGIVILFLTSCAHNYTITSLNQLADLPVSSGINGGSFAEETPWQYRGSNYNTHQFYYYFHSGNLLQRREVSIPRRVSVLHFEGFAFEAPPQWVTLQTDATSFHFYRHKAPPIAPKFIKQIQ